MTKDLFEVDSMHVLCYDRILSFCSLNFDSLFAHVVNNNRSCETRLSDVVFVAVKSVSTYVAVNDRFHF